MPIGPYLGMRDSLDPTASVPELARLLRNVYPKEPDLNGRCVGRPGFSQLGAQLGGGGDVQFLGQFTTLAGVEYTIAIVGGKFYTLNWSNSTWTEVVTAANFSSASITVSSSARFYAVVFANTMVFTDGVNKPWTWTGASGAGGLTPLTNAAVAFGPLAVYYAKLVMIKNTDRSAIIWSEEAAANTGYEAGGFNNAWTLGQTDQNPLTCVLAANESLYVFRDASITEIFGEVTPDFSSTGTRESVSSTVGTRSPGSVFFVGRNILFADNRGRTHMIRPGGGVVPLFEDFIENLKRADSTKLDEIEGYLDPTLDLAIMAYEETGASDRSMQLCYHAHIGVHAPQASAVFDGYTFTRVGEVKNAAGDARILHGSTDGYVYLHGTTTTWNDGFNSGSLDIRHDIHTHFVRYSPQIEAFFDRADLMIEALTDTSLSIRSETNAQLNSTVVAAVTGGAALWDVALWDVDVWAADAVMQHVSVGIFAHGAYCALRISHQSGVERFGFVSGTIRGRPVDRYPLMP